MNFSIVLPTRERPELLVNLLHSIALNTTNKEDIEVLVAIDDDDTSYDHLDLAYSFVKVFRTRRSKDMNFSRDYYNFLAKKSTGRWIIAANDDCQFETPGWDEIAFNTLKDLPGVIYGWMEDGLGEFRAKGHGNYCCFPLQGRAGVEALGGVFPERIPNWGADIWAKNLYDSIDSVVEIPIKLIHYNYHNGTREQDEVSKRIARNQVSFDMKPTYSEINSLLGALRKELNAFSNH